MKKTLLIIIFLSSASCLFAQDFQFAGGFRFWSHKGLSVKTQLFDSRVAEGIISFRPQGILVTGLLERYRPVAANSGWWWYYGAGAHIGSWNRDFGFPAFIGSRRSYTVGADLIAGIEYTWRHLPFSVSLDYKPTINLISRGNGNNAGLGLSFRYRI